MTEQEEKVTRWMIVGRQIGEAIKSRGNTHSPETRRAMTPKNQGHRLNPRVAAELAVD